MDKIIDKLKLDIVHVQQPLSIGRDGLRQARRLGIPVVFTNHTKYEDYTHYVPIFPQKLLKWHVRHQSTSFANKCDHVVAPSQEIKDIITANGVNTPITVIPTGIDCARFRNGNREGVRQQFGILPDEILLHWNGRMENEKNVDFLIEAAIKIVGSSDKVKMTLVGDGSERKLMEEKVKQAELQDKIIFCGLTDPSQVQDYYCSADIFLQPSLTETQGISTTEALAAGLAVAAIRATGSSDQIVHNKNGILMEDNLDDFIEAVETLIKNTEKRRELSKNALQMSENMSYQAKTRELEKIYLQLRENLKIELPIKTAV